MVWDYAPDGRNEITGKPFDQVADTYVKSGVGRIGSKYVKCLYRGYTQLAQCVSQRFTSMKPLVTCPAPEVASMHGVLVNDAWQPAAPRSFGGTFASAWKYCAFFVSSAYFV